MEESLTSITTHPAAALLRPQGRSREAVAFELEVISFFYDGAEIVGAPKSLGLIYGLCFATATPLTFADIENRLSISKGSISQGLRVLVEIGALKRVESSDRRIYFAPDLELRKLATLFIEERLGKHLSVGSERLKRMRNAAAQSDGEAASLRELTARIKVLQDWHQKSKAVLPMIKGMLRLT